MDFLICDSSRLEVSVLPDGASVDMDIGGENDVEVVCEGGLDYGMYLIYPGTEYGALIEEAEELTNSTEITWRGDCFRGFLEQIIIEPPSGEDYKVVSGDANDIIRDLVVDKLGGMFDVPEDASGIEISRYQFNRYTDALSGLTAMLKEYDARINIEIIQGGPNERFTVELSAVPIQDLAQEIEYSQDAGIVVTLNNSRRGITHLICLGQGELAERTVIHLYLQADGTVGTTQVYFGLEERTAVYDYSSAEDEEELIRGGTERLLELAPYKSVEMDVTDEINLEIGDIIAGRNYETGLYVENPIVSKIVKLTDGILSVEYKTEGAE